MGLEPRRVTLSIRLRAACVAKPERRIERERGRGTSLIDQAMGNCGASRHAVESWTDDGEWEEETSSSERDHRGRAAEQEHASEVTIRITRRQLHELTEKKAGGGGGHGRRAQLLADIMNSGEVRHHEHHYHGDAAAHWHWKPALQSIPEAVEP